MSFTGLRISERGLAILRSCIGMYAEFEVFDGGILMEEESCEIRQIALVLRERQRGCLPKQNVFIAYRVRKLADDFSTAAMTVLDRRIAAFWRRHGRRNSARKGWILNWTSVGRRFQDDNRVTGIKIFEQSIPLDHPNENLDRKQKAWRDQRIEFWLAEGFAFAVEVGGCDEGPLYLAPTTSPILRPGRHQGELRLRAEYG